MMPGLRDLESGASARYCFQMIVVGSNAHFMRPYLVEKILTPQRNG